VLRRLHAGDGKEPGHHPAAVLMRATKSISILLSVHPPAIGEEVWISGGWIAAIPLHPQHRRSNQSGLAQPLLLPANRSRRLARCVLQPLGRLGHQRYPIEFPAMLPPPSKMLAFEVPFTSTAGNVVASSGVTTLAGTIAAAMRNRMHAGASLEPSPPPCVRTPRAIPTWIAGPGNIRSGPKIP